MNHPVKKFFGECTDLKIKLDQCFRQEVPILVLLGLVRIDDDIFLSVPMWELMMLVFRFPKCCFVLCEIQKALKRKANFEESKKFKERLQAYKREMAEENKEH